MDNQFRNNLRLAYDRQASRRNDDSMQEWKKVERADFFTLLKRENRLSLLEIGAGAGWDGLFFQDQGFKVTCIDLSPGMIKYCVEKGLNAQVMDMTKLTFAACSFDAVYSMNSLLHLTKAELPDVLRQIAKIPKEKGLFFMGVYGGENFEGIKEDDINDPKRFFSFLTDDDLRKVVSNEFDILSFKQIEVGIAGIRHFQSLTLRKH
jgi:SAM-dependent methyltransferase